MRGRSAKRLVKQVKVPRPLGEHQDSDVPRGLLRELGGAAPAAGGNYAALHVPVHWGRFPSAG